MARSALTYEFVEFFERNVDLVITEVFGFVGSLVFIAFYDLGLAAAALTLTIAFALLNAWIFRRSARAVRRVNDEFEREADVLAPGSRACWASWAVSTPRCRRN